MTPEELQERLAKIRAARPKPQFDLAALIARAKTEHAKQEVIRLHAAGATLAEAEEALAEQAPKPPAPETFAYVARGDKVTRLT